MTFGQRERWLGRLAEEQLAQIIPPRPPKSGAALGRRNRWKPYTRAGIAQAFSEWSRLHGGKAPSKADWSAQRDPEGLWPRAAGESFLKAVKALAAENGVQVTRTAPCRSDPDQEYRHNWHWWQGFAHANSGPVAGGEIDIQFSGEPDPGPYCEDCFHGSGCRLPDMSPWQYAVEEIGGLRLRSGGDFHATRSRRDQFGRTRQMVTGGVAAAPDVVHIDASLDRYVS